MPQCTAVLTVMVAAFARIASVPPPITCDYGLHECNSGCTARGRLVVLAHDVAQVVFDVAKLTIGDRAIMDVPMAGPQLPTQCVVEPRNFRGDSRPYQG